MLAPIKAFFVAQGARLLLIAVCALALLALSQCAALERAAATRVELAQTRADLRIAYGAIERQADAALLQARSAEAYGARIAQADASLRSTLEAIHAAPPSTLCASSPALVAAAHGVRRLYADEDRAAALSDHDAENAH